MSENVNIHPSWYQVLKSEFEADYMKQLRQFLADQLKAGKVIYPRGKDIFAAYDATPFDQVRVVILGQDPYHGPGQAHGLCFSVQHGIKPPPSLVNIFKELDADMGVPRPEHGSLIDWAGQGVFLLNATLTVEHAKAGSHQKKGWERFTDATIQALAEQREGIVFVLWGSYAQKKGAFIDQSRHLVIKSPHPSPLSAHRGFFGSRPFSKINAYLEKQGQRPVDWSLGMTANH